MAARGPAALSGAQGRRQRTGTGERAGGARSGARPAAVSPRQGPAADCLQRGAAGGEGTDTERWMTLRYVTAHSGRHGAATSSSYKRPMAAV